MSLPTQTVWKLRIRIMQGTDANLLIQHCPAIAGAPVDALMFALSDDAFCRFEIAIKTGVGAISATGIK